MTMKLKTNLLAIRFAVAFLLCFLVNAAYADYVVGQKFTVTNGMKYKTTNGTTGYYAMKFEVINVKPNGYYEVKIYSDTSLSQPGSGSDYRVRELEIPQFVLYNGTSFTITKVGNLKLGGSSGSAGKPNSTLNKVILPPTIEVIGEYAFHQCMHLKEVIGAENLRIIERQGFYDCNMLASLPDVANFANVEEIGYLAFCRCDSLRTANLASIKKLGVGSFAGNSEPDYVLFRTEGLTSLVLGEQLEDSIPENCFLNQYRLTSVEIPGGVEKIGKKAFYGCEGLTSVKLHEGLKIIEESAFGSCRGLTSFEIPASVNKIGNRALSFNINTITVHATTPPTLGTQSFSKTPTVYVPVGCRSLYLAANEWKKYNIEEMSALPISFADANVKAICVANWDTDGDGELSEAEAAAVTDLGEVFKNDTTITSFNELQYFTGLTEISSQAFSGCLYLNEVIIPENVTVIGTSAFNSCVRLASITIPEGVTTIGFGAFMDCAGLTSIHIPASVTLIDKVAFGWAAGLQNYFDSGFPSVRESITVAEGNTVYDSRENCNAIIETATNTLMYGCSNTIIPSSVTAIAQYSFNNSVISSIVIPRSVTAISGFVHCKSLTSVTVENPTPITINRNAFTGSYDATLYVPKGSKAAYEAADYWKNFSEIVEMEDSSPKITNLLSNKWSGAEYSVQAVTFDSGVNYGNGTESNPNYNQIVGVPETDSKGRNWYEFDYTCNWQEMTAPLNNWCQGGNFGDIYARRTFYYDEEMPEELFLACGHDDAPCEYYLNGELIWSVTDGWFEQEIYKLTSAQKALLRPGELNVLAFHVHQNWGGMYADCGLYTSLSEMGISNKCGDNLIWSFNGETETLTISGTGDMYDFSDNSQTPWIGFKNSIKNLDVQSGVTRIGGNAFNGCTALSSVTISNSVTVVGSWAFCDCKSLTSITIPEGVINIRDNVFRNCTSLTSVSLPESLKTLGGHAFLGCRSLASITIPDGITFLDRIAFQECSSLTTFTYNKAENALTKVNGVYQIGTAEDLCNFAILSTAANSDISAQLTADIDYTGYTFPGSNVGEHFQHIGLNGYRGMFDGNGHTITVNINNPDSWQVAALFRELGKGGVIKNLRVAGHVESVSKFSAGIVSNLKSGKVSHCVSDVDIISHIDGDCTDGGIAGIATYDGEESIVEYCVVAGSFQGSNAHHRGGIIGIGSHGISDNITIDNCLFLANVDGLDVTESGTFIRQPTDKTTINNCYYLNVLGTVSTGTQITTDQLTSGELCFLLNGDQSNIDWTQNLTGDAVDSYPLPFSTHAQVYAYGNTYSNNDLSPIITFADANVKALCVANWNTNGDGELSEAEAAAVADLGEVFRGNTTITSFNELQYFTSLTTIGDNAFRECTALTSVTIPEGVQHIGYWAFCESGLTSITLPEGITNFCNAVFAGCRSLTSVEWPSDMTEIADYTFYQCSSLTSIHIPDGVTTIGHSAFRESGLESIAFPNSVTNIGSYVFDDCNNLTTVTMPASVITFDENDGNAFGDTNNIEAVYISDLTAWLNTSFPQANNPLRSGAKLYLNNVEVKDLVIPEGTTAILKAAFEGCESLTSVSIPNSVTSINGWAFAKCNNLTSATIPESVTSIGDHLFAYCSSLSSVTIPSSVTTIDSNAFMSCGSLTDFWCYAEDIPSTGNDLFLNTDIASATLHVPAASLEAYSTTAPWSGFGTIVAIEEEVGSNAIACADITAYSGHKVELPIMLTNDADLTVVGISFTLTLPEGVTVAKDEYGDPLYSLESTRLNPKRFNVYTNQYADGSWGFRISTNNTTAVLNGTEGEFMTITLDIADGMEEGDYNVCLMENKLSVRNSDNNIASKVISDSVSKLTINNVVMGDVNGDGEVDLSDAIMVTYYSLHVAPANFIEAVADVNGDGEIDLSDAITIIYKSLGVQ